MALTKVPSNLDSITATTQSQGDGSTNVATTAYVDTGLNALIDSAPGNLNTLNELAAAMSDNASFFSTVLPLSGGTMTGNIAHASDLTLDLGGDLIVDVDGDNVFFDAAGTRFLSISQVSSDVYIGTEQNDKDLIFRGKDGSSTITALTLDMSDAGTATFNHDVKLGDNSKFAAGGQDDLQIYHDGNSHIYNNTGYTTLRTATASGYLYLHGDNVHLRGQSANEPMLTAVCNGPVKLYYDNSIKLETKSYGTHTSGTAMELKTTSSTANDRAGAGFTATESATDGDRRAVMYLDADNGGFSTGNSGAYFYMEKKGGGGEVNLINQDTADMNFQTGGAHKRITIKGTGNVGINQNSPQAKLDIKGDTTTYAGMSKIYLTDTSSNSERRNWAIGNGGSGYGHFQIGVSNAADGDPMASGTHTTPLVIDHEGHVSIGGYGHPGLFYSGANQLVVGNGVGDQGITIYAGSSDLSRLHFADGTSGNAEYAGFIAYDHDNEFLQIGSGADGGTDIILNNNAIGLGTGTSVVTGGAKVNIQGTYASTAPATSGTSDNMTLRLSQTSGTGVLDLGWGDQGSNGHFWLQSRLSSNYASNYAIGLNPNGGNVFIGQKFTNKGALTISEAGNTAGAAIDGVQLYKGLTNASNFLAWQQGNMGWRLGIRHNDGGYPLTLYMNLGSTPTAASPGDEILRFGTDQNMALNNTTTGWSAWGADTSTHLTVGNGGNSPTTCNYGVLNLLGAQGGSTHFSIGVGNGTMYAAYDYGNGAHRLTINSSGNFTGSASNDISDQRLKENIVTIPNALDKVKALKGRTFTWKASSKQATGTKYGFIAQEVESVASDLVYKDSGLCKIDSDDNPIHDIHNYEGDAEYAKSVQTSGIIPILVEAMKEQQTIIEDLKARIETLEG